MTHDAEQNTHPGSASTGSGFGRGYSGLDERTVIAALGSPPGGIDARRKRPRRSAAQLPDTGSRPTLLDDIFADFNARPDTLEAQATQRREPRNDDPVADGIEWAIRKVRLALAEIDAEHEYLSPEQYGSLHGDVTPQTVCNWIRDGELDAVSTPHGWRIKRGARRQRKRSAA